MKTVVADAAGNWTASFDFIEYPFITATARDSRNNTSELSPAKAIMPTTLDFFFPPNLCLGQPVTFDNTTTTCPGNFTFQWDFGDGSAVSNSGTHTYTAPGSYMVTLTMLPSIYCKIYKITKPILIKNCCSPCKPLDFEIQAVCVNDTATFVNTSMCPGNPNFVWNFGDGSAQSSTGVHIYTVAGTYTVKLIIYGSP
ncbi:MAG: PKD domain-containing protein [Saprospiraceae bacterium]|nr:PKD domain-containing protein [Saprospiraceae bacterium]